MRTGVPIAASVRGMDEVQNPGARFKRDAFVVEIPVSDQAKAGQSHSNLPKLGTQQRPGSLEYVGG